MKSMKLVGLRRMAATDVPDAVVRNDNDVAIKMARMGICGSDVHYYAEGGIGSQRVQYPWTVGHEGSGVVVAVGKSVKCVQVGDRIAFDPAQSCGVCDQCLEGRSHTCGAQKFMGCPGQIEGCLSTFVVIPDYACYRIPDEMTLEEAALVEPLSIAGHSVILADIKSAATIAVLGAGPIGLSVLLCAKAHGISHSFVSDKIDSRLEVAVRSGADWVGNPSKLDLVAEISKIEPKLLDVVFECTGEQEAIDQAVELLKPGGKLMLIGIPGAANRISFDINKLRRKELCIQNVRRQNNCVGRAIELIASKQVDVLPLVTHRFSFDDAQDGFEMVADYRDGIVKAMVTFDEA